MSIKDWLEFILYVFLISGTIMGVVSGFIFIIDRKMRNYDDE